MKLIQKLILLLICGLSKKKDFSNLQEPTNILINARFKIGDSIMLSPLIRELKLAYPNIQIDLLAGKDNNFMFPNNPYVHKTFTLYRGYLLHKNIINIIKLHKQNYSVIIDVTPLKFGNYIYLKLLNAKTYIADDAVNRYSINLKEYRCYDILLDKQKNLIHMSQHLSRYLEPFDVKATSTKTEVYFSNADIDKATAFLKKFSSKKNILINIDGSAKEKCFTVNDYAYISKEVSSAYPDYNIFISSLSTRRNEVHIHLNTNLIKNVHQLYETKTIFEIMAFISKVDLLISPDTSLVHIATALNIKCSSVYCGNLNILAQWHPNSHLAKLVKSPIINKNSIIGFDNKQLIKNSKELLND